LQDKSRHAGHFANKTCSKTPLKLLTKGDNNLADDTELYAAGQSFLNRKEDVIGSVVGFIPFVGYVTILLSEHPWLKQVMLGIMGLMVVLQRE
jgi:signal peptidase